jgi:hypothetical protein
MDGSRCKDRITGNSEVSGRGKPADLAIRVNTKIARSLPGSALTAASIDPAVRLPNQDTTSETGVPGEPARWGGGSYRKACAEGASLLPQARRRSSETSAVHL